MPCASRRHYVIAERLKKRAVGMSVVGTNEQREDILSKWSRIGSPMTSVVMIIRPTQFRIVS